MKHSKDSIMGQYPSPYDAGPYPSAPGGSYEAPHGAGGPTYGPGGAPYAGGQAYAPNGAPSNQAVPMAMPAPMPMPMPAPVFVVPPPNPEEVAEKSRRTTRGLGLGAVITGAVSVAIQVLYSVILVVMVGTADSWTTGAAVTGGLIVVLGIFVMPVLVGAAWATSFGLSLGACVRASGGGARPQPVRWAGAGGIMGGALGVSVLQGLPFVILFFAFAYYVDNASSSDGGVLLVVAAVIGIALLIAHIALIIKIRGLGTSIEEQVPYA